LQKRVLRWVLLNVIDISRGIFSVILRSYGFVYFFLREPENIAHRLARGGGVLPLQGCEQLQIRLENGALDQSFARPLAPLSPGTI